MEKFIVRDDQKLAYGYTTGSCAAAAAKAAVCMLLSGEPLYQVRLLTPKGFMLLLKLQEIRMTQEWAECAVKKDAGDDPDVTNGTLVYARVCKCKEPGVVIEGGIGVGRVTKPGLDQPVGAAAINSVPRRMIGEAVQESCAQYGYSGGISVVISIPEGVKLAAQTFNPRLGIVGGISVLGTTGIVEPMSEQALLDTIRVELKVKQAAGDGIVAVAPGNYGQAFLKRQYGFELDNAVKCSNFVGDTVDMAVELGFRKMLFTGHLGKLIKIVSGVMNTHSRYGDGRMENICALARIRGAQEALLQQISQCVSTDEAVRLLREADGQLAGAVMADAAEAVKDRLQQRALGRLQTEVILFTNVYGLLARTAEAEPFVRRLQGENNLEKSREDSHAGAEQQTR